MPGILNVLIILVILLVAVVAIGLAVLSQVAKRLRQATVELEKKLTRLELRLDSQDKTLAAIRKSLEQPASDPIMELVRVAQGWSKNGPWPTVAALGSRIFRSYWGHKRSNGKALPKPSEAKK